jgi:hypothetical protein
MQGLELNEVQASLISELITDIPNDKLKDFLVFRMKFIDQYKSKELITKEALFEYQKIKTLHRIRNNEKVFENINQMIEFIESHYKNKELGNGLAHYYDYVVIGLDKDCNLINKFKTLETGNYYKLNSEEKAKVYSFLFEHQYRIGKAEYYPVWIDEYEKIENKEVNTTIENKNLINMLSKFKGKIN